MSEEKKDNVLLDSPENTVVVPAENEHREHHHEHHHEHHGHGSHRSHNDHSHHRRSYRRSKNDKTSKKLQQFFKKRGKLICAVCSVCFLLVFVSVVFYDKGYENGFAESNQNTVYVSNISIKLAAFEEPVQIANGAVVEYMNSNPTIYAGEIFDNYRNSSCMRYGNPVTFSYSVSGISGKVSVEHAVLEIREKEENAKSNTYSFDGSQKSINVYNLKGGTEYEYTVAVTMSDGSVKTAQSEFVTAAMPRMIKVDGIYNVRDIGGWKTIDNKVIKQGLLYRGTEIDGAVEPTYKLTANGMETMRNELGIVFDMDLRDPQTTGNSKKPLGIDIPHVYYVSTQYSDIFAENGKERMKWIFTDLAKEENYPIYMHCTYGCDRTGTVCYILEALLGVGENDLIRDYELSNLFVSILTRNNILTVYNGLQDYEGNALQEKAENYLLSCGVTQEQIDNIRNILLTEAE